MPPVSSKRAYLCFLEHLASLKRKGCSLVASATPRTWPARNDSPFALRDSIAAQVAGRAYRVSSDFIFLLSSGEGAVRHPASTFEELKIVDRRKRPPRSRRFALGNYHNDRCSYGGDGKPYQTPGQSPTLYVNLKNFSVTLRPSLNLVSVPSSTASSKGLSSRFQSSRKLPRRRNLPSKV